MSKIDALITKDFKRFEVNNSHFNSEQTCLVTGGGGSIGSEICKQLLNSNIKKLVLIESSEYALFKINSELNKIKEDKSLNTEIIPLLQDVGDLIMLEHNLANECFDYVYHAAAYKHVNMLECNVISGMRNNVYGTRNLLSFLDGKFRSFTLISTDKAVEPTNFMGLSKRICEHIVLGHVVKEAEKLNIVRFGNVLHSSGSVIPIFEDQIKNGGPVTVTDADATRFFMTIPEAVALVMASSSLDQSGNIYVLDMGEPVKILDLAIHMIKMAGFDYSFDDEKSNTIKIKLIGIRKGEKVVEKLSYSNHLSKTSINGVLHADETREERFCLDNFYEFLDKNDIDGIKTYF